MIITQLFFFFHFILFFNFEEKINNYSQPEILYSYMIFFFFFRYFISHIISKLSQQAKRILLTFLIIINIFNQTRDLFWSNNLIQDGTNLYLGVIFQYDNIKVHPNRDSDSLPNHQVSATRLDNLF